MPAPKSYGQTGRPLTVAPRFRPGGTALVATARVKYTLVSTRSRGYGRVNSHAVVGSYSFLAQVKGRETACGKKVSSTGAILYRPTQRPSCPDCTHAITSEVSS